MCIRDSSYIAQVLQEGGLDKAGAHRRAVSLYLSNVGYTFISAMLRPKEEEQALADVVSFATAPTP